MSSTNEPSELFERVYDRLRALAERYFRGQPSSATLQPTALVHEAYVRLARQDEISFKDSEHFLAVAATAMRQIVIDQARRRQANKRGGKNRRVTLSDVLSVPPNAQAPQNPGFDPTMGALEVDTLISRLGELNPRQAQIVELRIFVGLTMEEIAKGLGVSLGTIEKDWRQARAWMRVELDEPLQNPSPATTPKD